MKTPPFIRVFISSTFLDMQEEREEVIKRVFPKIKAKFEQRRVVIREVDLRWGIPQSEIEEGKLLEICLEEVINCNPFFICFLGSRYGTIVKEIPEKLLQTYDWLQEHQNKSITELEILQGVFIDSKQKSPHAFFYLRKPSIEGAVSAKYDRTAFDNEDQEQKHKLDELKNRIRKSPFTVREYDEPQQLAELLFDDLTELIEKLFPPENVSDTYAYENLWHRIFIENFNFGYLSSNKYFNEIDRFKNKSASYLFVTGEVGSGKSALLANWVLKSDEDKVRKGLLADFYDKILIFFNKNKETIIFTHFVGSTDQSYDWANLLRRLMFFLREHFQLELEIPELRHLLPAACQTFLQAIQESANVILVIDAIDEINVDNEYSNYSWLPSSLPKNVKVILSARNYSSLGELKNYNHKRLEINSLRVKERVNFIINYLGQYRKKIDRQAIDNIASVEATANPLYLTTVLEEMRLVAKYENELNELMTYYLSAENLQEVFEKYIFRLEKDFDSGDSTQTKIVSNTFRLLWTSQNGLSEDELAELLGSSDKPLVAAIWSPFYIAIKKHLLNRNGLLTFFHDSFRQTVEKIYLSSDEEKLKSHQQIADYFNSHKNISRRISELPRHLAILNKWEELSNLLADPVFFNSAWKLNRYEIRLYWSLVEKNSDFRLLKAYRPIFDEPDKYEECLWALISLLNENGNVSEVYKLAQYEESKARIQNDYFKLQACLSLKAEMLKKDGNLDAAFKVLQENESVCQKIENQTALAACLGNQAVILYEKGNFHSALKLHEKEEIIYRRLRDSKGLSVSLGNQALNCQKDGNIEQAINLLKEQEKLCRQLGDLSGLQKNLGNQGLIYWNRGNSAQAVELLKMSEDICRKLDYQAELLITLGNQAVIFESVGNYDAADSALTEKEKICRKNQNQTELANTLWRHSQLYFNKLHQPDFAKPLAEEAVKLAKELNNEKLLNEIREFIRSD